jgi:hypothetical protein
MLPVVYEFAILVLVSNAGTWILLLKSRRSLLERPSSLSSEVASQRRLYIYIYIYIWRVYSVASYRISYFVATSIYDNFIY